ncbi:MAG: DUF2721 domain-containing protein [Candidatus Omnitrophica bacterium]|nr:DUF2721 domain-containing protein [Candidatus Omnitrophota bacterium]
MDIAKLIQEIQYILAPAMMISSSSLLLLGFQNKFSNLTDQVKYLFRRATLVKNTVLFTYGSIFFFTVTSILILADIYFTLQIHCLIISTFAAGLCLMLTTAVVMMIEAKLFYRVILLEKNR